MSKNNKHDFLLKAILVGAVLLIALSLFIYVLRPSKTKSAFETCYEECIKLGRPPENGKCDTGTHLVVLKTNQGERKKGDSWCYANGGNCITLCRDGK